MALRMCVNIESLPIASHTLFVTSPSTVPTPKSKRWVAAVPIHPCHPHKTLQGPLTLKQLNHRTVPFLRRPSEALTGMTSMTARSARSLRYNQVGLQRQTHRRTRSHTPLLNLRPIRNPIRGADRKLFDFHISQWSHMFLL